MTEAHLEHGVDAIVVGQFANPFGTATVERDHGIAGGGAVDDDEVVRLLSGEADFAGLAFGREGVGAEVGHGVSESATHLGGAAQAYAAALG